MSRGSDGREPVSVQVVDKILRKVLIQGGLQRMPRNPAHCDVILALVSRNMQRRYPYTEIELNTYLADALAELRASVDHVTCRRYLVDCGFVKRDRAGERYFLNYLRLKEAVVSDVLSRAQELVADALAAARN